MPLLFFIDKDILDDPSCKNVEDVVLSYTFFRLAMHFSVLPLCLDQQNTVHDGTSMANWNLMLLMMLFKNHWDFQSLSTLRKGKQKRPIDKKAQRRSYIHI